MKRIDGNRLYRMTPEDVDAFYPQALFLALYFLRSSAEIDPERQPLSELMGAYLDSLRDRVVDQGVHLGDSLAMSVMVLRRMQLDDATPLFGINWSEETKRGPVEDLEFRVQVHFTGDKRVLLLALLLTLEAIVPGERRFPVDTSGFTGEQLAVLNDAVALMPRISINMEDAMPLH